MRRGQTLTIAVLAMLLLALNGCKLGAAVAYKVFGPPDIPPRYVPVKEPTLVLVENYRQPSMMEPESEHLSRFVVNEWSRYGITPVVEPARLGELRDAQGPAYQEMKIPAIARAVGAKQVLYVDLLEAGIQRPAGTEMARGQISARVRIVDAHSGKTLWPTDEAAGFPVFFQSRYRMLRGDVTESTVRQETYSGAADRIVALFRKHKPEDLYEDQFEG